MDTITAQEARTAEPNLDTLGDLVAGVADVRRVPLSVLARDGQKAVADGLSRVLPGRAAGQVPVSAFNSSI